MNRNEMERLVRLHHTAVETGDLAMAREAVAPAWHNRESGTEPEACRQPGPAGLLATSAWLRAAFSDLRFHETAILVDGDTAIWWGTMSGRHTGPFVVVDKGGPQVFPPTGATFEFEQVHWHRFDAGQMVEHRAVRKDLALMQALGYLPPTPGGVRRLVRARLTGSGARAIREVFGVAARAGDEARPAAAEGASPSGRAGSSGLGDYQP